MSNHITIELCAEDRARLDRLAEALERRACDNSVATVETPDSAPEVTEAAPPTTIQPKEEQPIEETPVDAPPTPTVDRAELRAKVIALSAKGLKEQTRDIIRSYAQTVTEVPEDKVAECYAQLVALEA